MPISDVMKVFLERQKEIRDQANLDRTYGLDKTKVQQSQQSIDLQKLAQEAAQKRFDEEQARGIAKDKFAQAEAGQAGIAQGMLAPAAETNNAPSLGSNISDAVKSSLPTLPGHEAGAVEYAPGQFLKAVPKSEQEKAEDKRALQKQADQRTAFDGAFTDFIKTHPEYYDANKSQIDDMIFSKTFGFPYKEGNLANLEGSATEAYAKALASGAKKGDPKFDAAKALFEQTIKMKSAGPGGTGSPLMLYNLGAEHQANSLAKDVDAIAQNRPDWQKKTPAEKDVIRRDTARSLGGQGKYTNEAVQRFIQGLGAEPSANPGNPIDQAIADILSGKTTQK